MRIYLSSISYRPEMKRYCAQHPPDFQFASRIHATQVRRAYRRLRKSVGPTIARYTIWDLLAVGKSLTFEYVEKETSDL